MVKLEIIVLDEYNFWKKEKQLSTVDKYSKKKALNLLKDVSEKDKIMTAIQT